MTNFTKPQLKAIREAMQTALDRMQDELGGVTFNVASCTYDGGEATFKVNVLLDGAETKEQKKVYAEDPGYDYVTIEDEMAIAEKIRDI